MFFEDILHKVLAISVLLWTYSIAVHWSPQMGTIDHPKTPELSQRAKQGDIYRMQTGYYRSLIDIDLLRHPEALDNLPENKNDLWRKINPGSYMLPKRFGVDGSCSVGDIFYNPEEELYYRARGNGHVLTDWNIDLIDRRRSICQWERIDDKENWMSLLRPEIGDTPLGNLCIPASHDSGTYGIDENGILVDRNFLFQVAERLSPQFLANWSLTHSDDYSLQLISGFRQLDLRVADTEEYDGQFRWWHGVTGDEISEGLDQIGQFARTHPEEILILMFGHFAAPGNALDPTVPIPEVRCDNISEIILANLGDQMTYRSSLSGNPTMNEVLATGRNLITIMENTYIRDKDDRYWDSVVHGAYSGRTNTEELFDERSAKLENFKDFHAEEMTELSGCVTPDEKIIIAGLLNVYGHNETILDIIEEIAPGLLEVNPTNMSFEGLWFDLLSMARYGVNTQGMHVRSPELFTNGASVHYSGMWEQARHWLARPSLYKPNMINTDDFLTSALVDLAIEANRGDIPREVSITLQGNPKSGYFEWDDTGFGTTGGTDGINCTAIDLRYTISDQLGDIEEGFLYEQGRIDIPEGLYPPMTEIHIDVMSEGSGWNVLWSYNIQTMIDTNFDVYIRGKDLEDGHGFAYLSTTYDDYGLDCFLPPLDTSNTLELIEW